MAAIEDVLRFWFVESGPDDWYAKDEAFDDAIRGRFGGLYEKAAAGALEDWTGTAQGCVALCIVLDQLPRNMFRGDARAFDSDPMARATARHAIDRGFDTDPAIDDRRRAFLYLPFQHSEDIDDQRLSVRLTRQRMDDAKSLDYAERHLRIIERFGRFPHRNATLGRESTAEETEFLSQDGSSF